MRRSLLLLALVGCSTGDGPADEETDEGTESGVETDVVDGDCGDEIPTDGAFLGVTVVDADGGPLGSRDVRVQYCRGSACLTANCVQDNVFQFGGLVAGGGSLEVFPLADGAARLSTPFVPYTVEQGGSHAVTVRVPELDAGATIPAAAAPLEVADGLFLTVGQGDVVAPSPLDPAPTELAGVDAFPSTPPIQGIDGEVLAVYYLSPFDYPTRAVSEGSDERVELPVKLTNRWSLGSDEAELWIGDYFTYAWTKVGDLATVEEGAALAPSAGITRISTLVVVRKPVAR